MTKRLAGVVAAGVLAVGILVGAAGTVLVHDATGPMMDAGDMGDMGDMHQMMELMGDSEMPMEATDPAEHERHHAGADE
jgi:hypothetical protein